MHKAIYATLIALGAAAFGWFVFGRDKGGEAVEPDATPSGAGSASSGLSDRDLAKEEKARIMREMAKKGGKASAAKRKAKAEKKKADNELQA